MATSKQDSLLDQQRRVRERRASERYELGGVTGTLTYNGDKNPCQIVDISLDGCLIRTNRKFPHGALAYIEVDLHLFGLILHIGGITQWVRQEQLIGVRFIHPTMRAKNELAGLLTCLVDQEAAAVIHEVLSNAQFDPKSTRVLSSERPVIKPEAPLEPKPQVKKAPAPPPETHIGAPIPAGVAADPFDWTAEMLFLKDNRTLYGTIVEIRMEGCAFELSAPFVGNHPSHIEVEFKIRGLPLRLSGQTFPTAEERIIAVRFEEASSRRQRQLAELVQEIQDAQLAELKKKMESTR